jgi:ribonuclease HI
MSARVDFDQINLHHCREATSVLRCKLDSGLTNIALIQEPHFYKGKILGLGSSGFLHFVSNPPLATRACIYTNKKVNAVLLNSFSNSDFVAVQIKYTTDGEDQVLICCSAYLPYDTNVPTKELVDITRYCNSNNLKLLIGCDANSHNIVWGSSDTNLRGNKLLEFIASSNLVILNKGNRPTFVNSIREQVIDITLCTNDVEEYVENWHVSQEDSLSDHQTIRFTISCDPSPPILYRNAKSTNWVSFKLHLKCRLEGWDMDVMNEKKLDDAVIDLTKSLILSYEENCPLRKTNERKNTPWYTSALFEIKRANNRAWNNRRSNPAALLNSRKEYKSACRKAKRKSWREFCESAEGIAPTARLHKILTKDRSSQVSSMKLPSGEYTSDESLVLEHLLNTHFPECINFNCSQPTPHSLRSNVDNSWSKASLLANTQSIRWAINSFSPFKAAGMDGIFPALLQHGMDLLLNPLHKIFTSSLAMGYIPCLWQEVKVVFIPKPGRTSYEEAKNHRPISLTSFLLKTLERLLDREIRSNALVLRPLCTDQHAYQRGNSTMTAFHSLISFIESTLEAGEIALAVIADIEGAFDRATFESFEIAAEYHDIDPLLIRWILSMLKNRTLIANLKQKIVKMRPTKGCPQGGVISPLIWLLISDSLIRCLKAANFFVVGYADDFAILSRGKFDGVVFDRMADALRIVERWCASVGLSVKPEKTGMIRFTKKAGLSDRSLNFFGHNLVLSDQLKYLGLLLDRKLNWGPHIDFRVKKSCMIYGQCRRAIGQRWGLSPKSVHWLYTMVVVPVLTYGSIVWWRKAQQCTVILKLNHLQRLGLLGITGAMVTTPTAALEVITGLIPLHILVESTARAELYRLHCWGRLCKNISAKGHASLWKVMVTQEPFWEAPSDCIIPTYLTAHNFKVIYPERLVWRNPSNIFSENDLVFYTDGSLRDGLAGYGIYSANPETSVSASLGHLSTVFQAEILAISVCLSDCLQIGLKDKRVFICSDSQAALKALNSYKFESKLVVECWHLLQAFSAINAVTLVWVPGHSDILGNENADSLARIGSDVDAIAPVPCVPLSKGWAKMTIKSWANTEHNLLWNKLLTCRQTKLLIKKPLSKIEAAKIRCLKREKLRTLVGVLTGHFNFNKHLLTMGLATSSLCSRCLEDEDTAYHLVCLCPSLARRRFKILGNSVLNELEYSKLGIKDIQKFISGLDLDFQVSQ